MNTTFSTISSVQTDKAISLVEKICNYEEAMAVLNYCRLVHKTTEIQPSPILSQWLLHMCSQLQKVHFSGNSAKDLKKVMKDYYTRYKREHKSNNLEYWLEDIIK